MDSRCGYGGFDDWDDTMGRYSVPKRFEVPWFRGMPERHPKPWESGSGWIRKTHTVRFDDSKRQILKQHVWPKFKKNNPKFDLWFWGEGIMDVGIHQNDRKFQEKVSYWCTWQKTSFYVGEKDYSDITPEPPSFSWSCFEVGTERDSDHALVDVLFSILELTGSR